MKDKIRLIYIPFLLIAVGFIVVYTFLHWLLFTRFELFPVKEDMLNFWLPFILPFIPVLIWLRPRIKLLQFKHDNGSFGYQLLAAFAIAAPTIIAQEYLHTATGKLTTLDNIRQVDQKPLTRYYALQHCFIDKARMTVQSAAKVTGKHNADLNYYLYVVMPILNSETDTANGKVAYWLGKKYHKKISNKLTDEEKQAQFRLFADATQQEFDTTAFERFTYLEKAGNTEEHDQFDQAIKKSPLRSGEGSIVFTAHAGDFADRNGSKALWIFLSLGIGSVVYFILLLFPRLGGEAVRRFKTGARIKDTDNDYKEMLSLLIPRKGFIVTPLILDINILVYIIMVFSGLGFISFSAVDLLHWGGNFRPSTTDGQYWRLLTSVFLHGGIMHLLANMIGFLFVGVFLEPILGTTKYMIAYLLAGILGSCASLWWHPATVSVGASGAIFGIYGLLLALIVLKAIPRELGMALKATALIFVGYNLLMGFIGAGIDNAAHIGGLLSGFILGILMAPAVRKRVALVELTNETEHPEKHMR